MGNTVHYSNGDWQTKTTHLDQWHIHELYCFNFNAIDKHMHNAKWQGGTSFEDTWKTHSWWVRNFQVLFGMSEVNYFILWNKVKPGQEGTTLTHFSCSFVIKC